MMAPTSVPTSAELKMGTSLVSWQDIPVSCKKTTENSVEYGKGGSVAEKLPFEQRQLCAEVCSNTFAEDLLATDSPLKQVCKASFPFDEELNKKIYIVEADICSVNTDVTMVFAREGICRSLCNDEENLCDYVLYQGGAPVYEQLMNCDFCRSGEARIVRAYYDQGKYPGGKSLKNGIRSSTFVGPTIEPNVNVYTGTSNFLSSSNSNIIPYVYANKNYWTGANNYLGCRYLAFSVGPKFNIKYQTAAHNTLHGCYRETFKLIHDSPQLFPPNEGPVSLSIPALYSSGEKSATGYGFPRIDCMHTTLRTTRRWLEKMKTRISCIVFVCENSTDVLLCSSLACLYFPRSENEEKWARAYLPSNCGNNAGELEVPERKIRLLHSFTNSNSNLVIGKSDSSDADTTRYKNKIITKPAMSENQVQKSNNVDSIIRNGAFHLGSSESICNSATDEEGASTASSNRIAQINHDEIPPKLLNITDADISFTEARLNRGTSSEQRLLAGESISDTKQSNISEFSNTETTTYEKLKSLNSKVMDMTLSEVTCAASQIFTSMVSNIIPPSTREPEAYLKLVKEADNPEHTQTFRQISQYKFTYRCGTDNAGRNVIVFNGALFPAAIFSSKQLLLYIVRVLDPFIHDKYVLLYINNETSISTNNPGITLLKELFEIYAMSNNLQEIWVLYPNLLFKTAFSCLYPLLPDHVWENTYYFSSLMEMEQVCDLTKIQIPNYVREYEKTHVTGVSYSDNTHIYK